MFTPRLLALSVAGLIGLASILPQTDLSTDSRLTSLENTQHAMVRRVAALETSVASTGKITALATPAPTAEPESMYDIVSFKTRMTELGNAYNTYAWLVILKNNTDKTLVLNVRVDFLDKDGFLLDHDTVSGLVLKPHEESSFTNTLMVSIDLSAEAVSTTVDIRVERVK